jgi:hypothetical protein
VMSRMGDMEPVSPLRERRSATRSIRLRRARVWSSICLSALVTVGGAVAVDLRPAAAAAPSAHVVFVATDGRPGADGTRAHPLASINGAVSLLASKGGPGIVKVRAGSYAQRVMLRNRHGVTIRAYRAEHVILDGGSLTPTADRSAMVTIVDSSHVTVAGLDIRGYDTTSLDAMPIGIYVHGSSSHIALRGNHVHSMGNYNGTLGSFDLNAHGIAVYGDRASHFAAPRLRHPSRGNLHLRSTSPAVDAGLRLPSGTVGPLDIDRQRRVRGGRIDIGADEKR